MELRYNEIDRARNIYERYVQCIPSVKAWVRYAKFEMKNGQVGLARRCYERAVGEMGEDAQTVSLSCHLASPWRLFDDEHVHNDPRLDIYESMLNMRGTSHF